MTLRWLACWLAGWLGGWAADWAAGLSFQTRIDYCHRLYQWQYALDTLQPTFQLVGKPLTAPRERKEIRD